MGNAQTGAMTDVMSNVWMDIIDDAWMGAMTDILHDVLTDHMDNAWMCAMTDIPYNVWTDGDMETIKNNEIIYVL